MTFFDRIRILPLLILVAGLSFIVRLGEFVAGARDLTGAAQAQEEVKVEPPAFPAAAQEPAEKPAEKAQDSADTAGASTTEKPEQKDSALKPDPSAKGREGTDGAPDPEHAANPDAKTDPSKGPKANDSKAQGEAAKPDWKDAADTDLEYADVKMELFQDLSERRKAIETREKELATREALLKAGEQELDQKFRELETLRKEIEGLLEQQSTEEEARIGSLVKIYEAMKPKDAARIFDSLDMDVLISVVSRMSERKTSPIMAEMNPERARSITILLAQQKQLPALPQE